MNYIQYDANGTIISYGTATSEAALEHLQPVIIVESLDDALENYYINSGELMRKPTQPSEYHEWDSSKKQWLPNLDAARSSRLYSVATELNRRLYLPCNGFDADNVSRERIAGTIARLQRGDGLPAGWIGWRDADNEMRWASDDAATVLANLTALSRAIEDREQALLVASWQHKANIADLTTVEEIIQYNVGDGWDC